MSNPQQPSYPFCFLLIILYLYAAVLHSRSPWYNCEGWLGVNTKLLFHSWADSLHLHLILNEGLAFYKAFFEYPLKWFIYSADMADGTCMNKLPFQRILCTPYNHAPCHFMQSHIMTTWWRRSRLWLPGDEDQGCDYLVMKIKVMITWWRGWGRKRTGAGSRRGPWGWWVRFLTVVSGNRCSPAHSGCCLTLPWWWLFGWVPLTGEVCVSVASWYLSVSE